MSRTLQATITLRLAVLQTLLALQTRFGAVPKDLAAAIRKAEPHQLEAIFRKALTASSLDEVVRDVTLH